MHIITLFSFWDMFISGITYSNYFFEATLFIALITLPTLKKRNLFLVRVLGSLAVIGFLYWLFFWPLANIGTWFTALSYLTLFVLFVLAIYLCYDVNFSSALFYGSLGHAAQNLTSHVYIGLAYIATNITGTYINHITEICNYVGVIACAVAVYFLITRRNKDRNLNFNTLTQLITLFLLITFSIVLNLFYDLTDVYNGNSTAYNNMFLFHMAMLIADIMLILYQESCYRYSVSEKDAAILLKMHSLEKKQMLETKALMDAISIKSHDLKHQLLSNDTVINEYKQEAMEQIALYDSFANTGNESLDVVLTQKKIRCSEAKIDFRFLADGTKLDFIKPIDIYSIMGNLLDNAIEAVSKIEEQERKYIFLKISSIDNKVVIHIENEYNGKIKFIDNMPQTTKENKSFHGFGVRSVAQIVEKYNGMLSISAANSTYTTDIVFINE